MDFNALRAQTLRSDLDEEAVTVNTRALIDKVLARYSGEWTVLRELVQNAADAGATKVTVRFETIPSSTVPLPQNGSPSSLMKHTIQHHTLKRLVVTNNGAPFNENDWTRLKRIAEGNPDETKIGAFGVGFYSVFADCEEPFVSSGREAMAFFWKNNSLFTRRLKLPETHKTMDTNFVLDYRDTTSSIPALLPLAQFLANSLTFVGIENIDLFIDQHEVLSLAKKNSPSQDVTIPRDVDPKTSESLMKVMSITKELAQIDGIWMPIVGWKQQRNNIIRTNDADVGPSFRKFFSRLAGASAQSEPVANLTIRDDQDSEDVMSKLKATIFLNVNIATIKTFTSTKFNEELERATKKPPPRLTKLSVLTAPHIEDDNSLAFSKGGDIFATVLPTKSGRIFIGFPTHQTTGLSAHISAPSVIPTVERESIDLNARYIRTWNIELLRAAGIVCRISWSFEMSSLRSKIVTQANGRSKIRMDDITPYLPEAVTTTKNFTFRESTPAAKIGQVLEDTFWMCVKKPSIEILSTCGVLPTHEIRLAPKDLSFVDGVPMVPEMLAIEAKTFVDKLADFALITEVTVADIQRALETNPLSEKQLREFLTWLVKQASQKQLAASTIANLLAVAVVSEDTQDGASSQLLVLGSIKHFQNVSRIPVGMPVPQTVIPHRHSRHFGKAELESIGWEELHIVPWIRWLLSEAKNRDVLGEDQDLTLSPSFSAQVFSLLSKQWDAISQSSRALLVELLSTYTVLPTKLGMKKPNEAYFPSVKLFDDLPIIEGLGSVKDKVLSAFGVRKTVELNVVFSRLLDSKRSTGTETTPNQNTAPGRHVALIQYLASVRDDIPSSDFQRLKNSPMCPKEDLEAESKESTQRYKISELFEPRAQLRDLGLPILAWPGYYRNASPEGRLLSALGLRTFATVPELISIMAKVGLSQDVTLRDKALTYFLSNYHAHGYGNFDYSAVTVPFLPLQNNSTELSIPSQCFVEESAGLFGFKVLKQDLQAHAPMFGVKRHPPLEQCINIMGQKPPTSHAQARSFFTYFASRLGEIHSSAASRLQDLNFVPVLSKHKEKAIIVDHVSPRNCFLGDSDHFGDIFNYVDFGQEANAFLLKCGAKIEPSKVEIAQILVREPARISSSFGNTDKYFALLRSLADSVAVLKKNKDLWRDMKKAPFLMAFQMIPVVQASTSKKAVKDSLDGLADEPDEPQEIRQWQLTNAENAFIVDDYIYFTLFKANILVTPEEDVLEDFYRALGSPVLSSLVEEAARYGPASTDQRPAQKLHKDILERSALFLHDQPPENVKHDARWLEKNLKVQLVSSISVRRSLRGRNISHVEKRTAICSFIDKVPTLSIVGHKPDLYQVSHSLMHILLNRPKLNYALTLEMLLKTDLPELQNRGFNVSRILRRKAAEERLAQSKRQQELEEEQKRIEEQRKAWQAQEESTPKKAQKLLPGGFPDSPDSKQSREPHSGSSHNDNDDHLIRPAQTWASNLVKQLGFGGRHSQPESIASSAQQQLSTMAGSSQDAPPPYSEQFPQTKKSVGGGGGSSSVTAPHQLRENLLNAIQKTRPHNSSAIFSRGETNTVSETKSYCDEKPSHDLAFVADLKYGIQMFLSQEETHNRNTFLSQNVSGISRFCELLKVVGDIFSLNSRTLNIFYETSGKTIAFNRNGSIFCNYLYFKQLHEAGSIGNSADGEADAIVYWWVILCHELAHNLVEDHSSDHSYYTEGFVAQYFSKVMRVIATRNQVSDREPRLIEL